MSAQKPMRLVFGETLCELAGEYPNMVVLDSDASSSTQTKWFGEKYPERFYNFGIQEANIVSAAAGMATFGLIPVVSTFAFLITLRAADPVHSLIAYNSLNVKLAGGYAGLSDFADGASHQSVMDLSVVRSMPNMTVLVPSDIETTIGAVKAMLHYKGPVYIRLSRDKAGSFHNGDTNFEIGRARVLKDGADLTIVFCGALIEEVLKAAEILDRDGVSTAVVEYPTLKPFDRDTLIEYARKTGRVVAVEEHTIIGGLGSAVAECLAEEKCAKLLRLGIKDSFGESGRYDLLLEKHGLTANGIAGSSALFLKERQ